MSNIAAHNSMEKIMDDTGGLRPRPDYLEKDDPWPPAWVKDFTRTALNDGQLGKRSESIGRSWTAAVEAAQPTRKPQKNAARAIEAVFTASDKSFKTDADWKDYLDKCRSWAEKKFGADNVLQWNTHYHEKVPHLHMILIPIVRDTSGNKYSSADFLGGPVGLRNLQTEFFEQVAQPLGLENRVEGSKKKHTDQSQWKNELVKQAADLDVRETAIKPREQAVEDREIDVENREASVRDRELAVGDREVAAGEKETELKKQAAALDVREAAIKPRETAVGDREVAAAEKETALKNHERKLKASQEFLQKVETAQKTNIGRIQDALLKYDVGVRIFNWIWPKKPRAPDDPSKTLEIPNEESRKGGGRH